MVSSGLEGEGTAAYTLPTRTLCAAYTDCAKPHIFLDLIYLPQRINGLSAGVPNPLRRSI